MALMVIQEVPADPASFLTWSFTHAAHHKDIIRVIFERNGPILSEYVLDPFNPIDMQSWLYQHQLMHDAQNAVLGIAGYNLTALDWEADNEVLTWFWNHGQEHYQAGALLNLG